MLGGLVKDTSLSDHHQDLLMTLLLEYSDVLARMKDELGCTNVLQHEIVTDGTTPIRQQFRRLSPDKKLEMQQLLHDILQNSLPTRISAGDR